MSSYLEKAGEVAVLINGVDEVGLLEGHPAGSASISARDIGGDLELLAVVLSDRNVLGATKKDLGRGRGVLSGDDSRRGSGRHGNEGRDAHCEFLFRSVKAADFGVVFLESQK